MADVEFDGYGTGPAPRGAARLQRVVHLAGAISSIALVLGLGWWGYRIAVRDVSGVPVVRALEGPMRSIPDPEKVGGEVTGHQGLAVNTIAASGTAAPVAEALTLAPRAEDLSEEDVAGLQAAPAPLAVAAAPAAGVVTPPPALPAAAPIAPLVDDAEGSLAETADGADLAAILAPPPVEAEAPPAEVGAAPAEEPATTDALVENPAVAVSPRPAPRPADLSTAAVAPADAAPAAPPRVVDPATLTAGERLVQLGAYDTAEAAAADWTRIANTFPDVMAGKGMLVQEASSGGRNFYRLRAVGFADDDDARRFCAVFQPSKATCIPLVWQ